MMHQKKKKKAPTRAPPTWQDPDEPQQAEAGRVNELPYGTQRGWLCGAFAYLPLFYYPQFPGI